MSKEKQVNIGGLMLEDNTSEMVQRVAEQDIARIIVELVNMNKRLDKMECDIDWLTSRSNNND